MPHSDQEFESVRAKCEQFRAALTRILDEPNNTLSDAKALREIVRIAKIALKPE